MEDQGLPNVSLLKHFADQEQSGGESGLQTHDMMDALRVCELQQLLGGT
jgi:hypothetical protein